MFTVDELCAQQAGTAVDFYLPGGNRGDGLIYEGARTIFRRHGLRVREVPPRSRRFHARHAPVAFIAGSGGWCAMWHSVPELARRVAAHGHAEVWVLPSTYDTSVGLVRDAITSLPDHVQFMCRERVSYDALVELIGAERVHLDHDTATALDYTPWRERPRRPGPERVVCSLRGDVERNVAARAAFCVPAGASVTDFSRGPYTEWRRLLDLVADADVVYTDRAHVSLSAALLGKETHILPCAYFKVVAMYEYTLADRDGVALIGSR